MDNKPAGYESKRSLRNLRSRRASGSSRSRDSVCSRVLRVCILLGCISLLMVSLVGISLSLLIGTDFYSIAWLSLLQSFYLMLTSGVGTYGTLMKSRHAILLFALLTTLDAIIISVTLTMDSLDIIDLSKYYANLHLIFLNMIPPGDQSSSTSTTTKDQPNTKSTYANRVAKAETAALSMLWCLDIFCGLIGFVAMYIGLRNHSDHYSIFAKREFSKKMLDAHHPSSTTSFQQNNQPHHHQSQANHQLPGGHHHSGNQDNVDYTQPMNTTIAVSGPMANQQQQSHSSWIQGRRKLRASDESGPMNLPNYESTGSSTSLNETPAPPIRHHNQHQPKLHIVNRNRNQQDLSLKAVDAKSKVNTLEKEFPLHPAG